MRNSRVFNCCVLLLGLALAEIGCSSAPENTGGTNTSAKRENKIDTHYVVMAQMSFSPEVVSVKKGDRLVFVNHDIVAHNIAETYKKAWVSPVLQPEESWVLEVTDTANYYCIIHPTMTGKIVLK